MTDLFNILDTVLNVVVFVFLGLLIWLYFDKNGESDE